MLVFDELDNFIAVWCDKEDCDEFNLSISAGRTTASASVISKRIDFEYEEPAKVRRAAHAAILRNRGGDYRYFVARVYRKGKQNPEPGEIVTIENTKSNDVSNILPNGDIIGAFANSQVQTAKILQEMIQKKDKTIETLQETNTRLQVKLEQHEHLAVIRELAQENDEEQGIWRFASDVLSEPLKLALTATVIKKRKQVAEKKQAQITEGETTEEETPIEEMGESEVVNEILQAVEELFDAEETRDYVIDGLVNLIKKKTEDNDELSARLIGAFMG